jgi:hypothetical protein
VEASNSCARSLIFGSFSFIVFLSKLFSFFLFIHTFFLSVWLSFLLFSLVFYRPSFSSLFYPCFLAHVVSYLAYPNLFGTKRLGCCYCCSFFFFFLLLLPPLLHPSSRGGVALITEMPGSGRHWGLGWHRSAARAGAVSGADTPRPSRWWWLAHAVASSGGSMEKEEKGN